MADQVIDYNNPPAGGRRDFLLFKQISWPAIFSGVLVALAVEVLFLSFGFFIGFRFSPGRGAQAWSVIWYFVGAFFSLMAGGWVAAHLSGNPARGKSHGIVTWGLATVATFVFLTYFSWGVVIQSVGLVRAATVASATAEAPLMNQAPNEANRELQNEAAQAQQQAPYVAAMAAHDVSNVALILWIGFMIAALGGIVGGQLGEPKAVPPVA